jgi:flagellar capping protein FliD
VHFEVEKIGGNRTALLEIAQQINTADIGVNAEVINDDDKFRIILTSDVSGKGGGFTVADLSGNSVEVSEMDTVVLAAQDSEFAIDGEQLTSSDNAFTLQDASVRVDLLQQTRQLVTIEIRSSSEIVISALDDFVIAFNDVLAFLANGTFAQAVRAKDALSSRIQEVRGELSAIGIEQDRTGRLNVNEEVFTRALRDNPKTVEALIGGADGIATKLAGELEQIASGPVARLQTSFLTGAASTSVVSAITSTGFALDVSG